MSKFRVDITGIGENVWSSNGITYETEEDAKKALHSLAGRWFGMDAGRVVPDTTPKGERFDPADPLIVLNYRKPLASN